MKEREAPFVKREAKKCYMNNQNMLHVVRFTDDDID